MPNAIPKLSETLAIIYEMEGIAGVEDYARANHIPMSVCRKLVDAYEPVSSTGLKLKRDHHHLEDPEPPMLGVKK